MTSALYAARVMKTTNQQCCATQQPAGDAMLRRAASGANLKDKTILFPVVVSVMVDRRLGPSVVQVHVHDEVMLEETEIF